MTQSGLRLSESIPFAWIAPGAIVLRNFVGDRAAEIGGAIEEVVLAAPFRNMETQGGYRMSVAMTNCGAAGWVSDREGYRYEAADPRTGRPWPAMPDCLREIARAAAAVAGFPLFEPDVCLVNRYDAGTRLALHQDRDERDFSKPIVSVSLGLPATFQFGGHRRSEPTLDIFLEHGDVVVWGGPSRVRFHGVLPLKPGVHPLHGPHRINLTFRKAL